MVVEYEKENFLHKFGNIFLRFSGGSTQPESDKKRARVDTRWWRHRHRHLLGFLLAWPFSLAMYGRSRYFITCACGPIRRQCVFTWCSLLVAPSSSWIVRFMDVHSLYVVRIWFWQTCPKLATNYKLFCYYYYFFWQSVWCAICLLWCKCKLGFTHTESLLNSIKNLNQMRI